MDRAPDAGAPPDTGGRPDRHRYYMGIAMAVRERADCLGSRVGAIVVVANRIVATGYNGTPENMTNCSEGGCHRCAHREEYPSGTGYDLCICVHAEANALLTAGRFGASTDASTVYTTDQPCFSCSKELIQAGVEKVYYARTWRPDERVLDDYRRLQERLHAEHVPTEYEISSIDDG